MKDLHGRREEWDLENCQRCEGDGWSRTDKPAQVILLGDVGHFGEDGSSTADLLTWVAAVRWADVILWGNHDRAVEDHYHVFKGYVPPFNDTRLAIERARAQGKLKLAFATHGFLMTHAGLHKSFRDSDVDPEIKIDPYVFADWINTIENVKFDPDLEEVRSTDAKYKIGARDAIGSKRGGRANAGGILWRDVTEKLYGGFRQVFGHSADRYHQVRYVWEDGNTRKADAVPEQHRERLSYCVDVGGKNVASLAGIWLPEERVVRVDL